MTSFLSDIKEIKDSIEFLIGENFTGVSEDQMALLERRLGVKLPQVFKDFLIIFGHDKQKVLSEENLLSYEELLDELEVLDECIERGEILFSIPANAVIFYDYSQVQFLYFLCEESIEDPSVYSFEGSASAFSEDICLSNFLIRSLKNIEKIYQEN